jgi:hypothetical protein
MGVTLTYFRKSPSPQTINKFTVRSPESGCTKYHFNVRKYHNKEFHLPDEDSENPYSCTRIYTLISTFPDTTPTPTPSQ